MTPGLAIREDGVHLTDDLGAGGNYRDGARVEPG
jgi:hypothetical protein